MRRKADKFCGVPYLQLYFNISAFCGGKPSLADEANTAFAKLHNGVAGYARGARLMSDVHSVVTQLLNVL